MKYVALLRGINVGGNKKVEMSKLKKAFERLGYADVLTYINSGNVIFSSGTSDFSALEQHLEKAFRFSLHVLIRDVETIQKLVRTIPKNWTNDSEQKTDVLFLRDDFDSKKSLALIKHNPEVDILKYVAGSIVWNVSRNNYPKSGMRKFIGTALYKNMTARNVNTVRKLAELLK